VGEDDLALVVVGPWLRRMTEEEFLLWLIARLQGEPVRTVQVDLVDLQIDVVLPREAR
jgi:hypothetical protein